MESTITFENNKTKYIPASLDPYYKPFLEALDYRKVCYKCKYANIKRIGDITLMDYWGIEKQHPDFVDSNGVSAILINTYKGKKILNILQERIELIKTTVMQIAKKNRNLKSPSAWNEIREKEYENLENIQYKKIAKKNLKFKKNIVDILKSLIPDKIKDILKKTIRR